MGRTPYSISSPKYPEFAADKVHNRYKGHGYNPNGHIAPPEDIHINKNDERTQEETEDVQRNKTLKLPPCFGQNSKGPGPVPEEAVCYTGRITDNVCKTSLRRFDTHTGQGMNNDLSGLSHAIHKPAENMPFLIAQVKQSETDRKVSASNNKKLYKLPHIMRW